MSAVKSSKMIKNKPKEETPAQISGFELLFLRMSSSLLPPLILFPFVQTMIVVDRTSVLSNGRVKIRMVRLGLIFRGECCR